MEIDKQPSRHFLATSNDHYPQGFRKAHRAIPNHDPDRQSLPQPIEKTHGLPLSRWRARQKEQSPASDRRVRGPIFLRSADTSPSIKRLRKIKVAEHLSIMSRHTQSNKGVNDEFNDTRV